jgi:hypothetical protein
MDTRLAVVELPASRGVAWIAESIRMFRRAPLAWIGLCSGWIVITLGLLPIPVVGSVAANFLQPVFFASFAIAARKQHAGEPIAVGDLFSGFRSNWRALVNVGAILLMAQIGILVVMVLLGLPAEPPADRATTINEYVRMFEGKELVLALGVLLTAVVKGALWFTPPLIAFNGMSTTHAIRWSVFAALANIGAMMAYGAVILLFLLAIGALAWLLGVLVWILGLLVVIPVMAISTYVGYREVFGNP